MSERDDNRYGEDVCIGFAMYCDEHVLSVEDGMRLAEQLADALYAVAESRDYVK